VVFGPGFIRLIGGMFDFLSSFVLMNLKLPPREPPAHVIAEYKHQAQTITCTCGWHGKSSSPDGRTSEWTAHLAANRTKPR